MSEEILPSDGPEWPSELSEPVAKLGKPSAVFRTSPQKAQRRVLTGFSMIFAGVLANYLYWVTFEGPLTPQYFLLVLLFGVPVSGFAMIYTTVRDRGLWVLVYPTGILRWQRGNVVSFPWAEIESISFVRVTRCETINGRFSRDGDRLTAWLPWDQTGSKMLGAFIELTRSDGATAILPTALTDFQQINQIVQEETFQEAWPRLWKQFAEGQPIAFGEWSLSLRGLRKEDELLRWKDFQLASIDSGKLIIRAQGKWRPWAEIPLYMFPNPHLFLALVEQGPPPRERSDSVRARNEK